METATKIYRTHENYGDAYFYTNDQRDNMERDVKSAFEDLEKFEDGDEFYLVHVGEKIGCFNRWEMRGSNCSHTGNYQIELYELHQNNGGEYYEPIRTEQMEIASEIDANEFAKKWLSGASR